MWDTPPPPIPPPTPRADAETAADRAEDAGPPAEPPRTQRPERRRRNARPVTTLAAWETLVPIVSAVLKGIPPAGPTTAGDLVARARRGAAEAVALVAAGFHSYHRADKAARYLQARDALSGCAATLRILAEIGGGHPVNLRDLADRVEAEAIPSVGALVRMMERKTADGGRRTADDPAAAPHVRGEPGPEQLQGRAVDAGDRPEGGPGA
jgi:hypothetical protein